MSEESNRESSTPARSPSQLPVGSVADELLGSAPSAAHIARRGFIVASLGFLAACASGGGTQRLASSGGNARMPAGIWTSEGNLPPQKWAQPASGGSTGTGAASRSKPGTPNREVVRADDKPATPAVVRGGAIPSRYDGRVIARTEWTRECPNPRDMSPLGKVRKITVHHTGNPYVFTDTSVADVKDELVHVMRGEMGAGHDDIAYHYVIDPAGRVWAARDIRWQGSHVRNWKGIDNREGNVGIMLLGNFERQRPTTAQLATLQQFTIKLQKQYGIVRAKRKGGVLDKNHGVFTHQQLSPTECPGDNLQNPWEKQIFPRLLAKV